MVLILIVLLATLLTGLFIGCRLTECLLDARTRRQSAVQRSLNSQRQRLASHWQELETAQRSWDREKVPPGAQPAHRGLH